MMLSGCEKEFTMLTGNHLRINATDIRFFTVVFGDMIPTPLFNRPPLPPSLAQDLFIMIGSQQSILTDMY